MALQQRYAWGRVYRDGSLVCGRVHVTIGRDDRLGLAPHERRYLAARFLDRVHPALRAELAELARRRGAAAPGPTDVSCNRASTPSAPRSDAPPASSKTKRSSTAANCARTTGKRAGGSRPRAARNRATVANLPVVRHPSGTSCSSPPLVLDHSIDTP
ncbi:MAG: hypothetical protein LC777_02695 [Actinobacteria bacterium]|nr:hypothetical protein [Actinomycetota bacterium]